MTLSKSQYIRGLQCFKSLWLYKKRPELRIKPDTVQEALFQGGYEVGDMAKKLFPGGVEIAFDPNDFDGMIRKTRRLIDEGAEVVYEAAFKEKGIFAMADILVKEEDGWAFYEVKSSTSVKAYHLDDAAVQWYALSHVLPLKRACLVHIDNGYVRKGELEPKKLLKIVDITDEALSRQQAIPQRLLELETVLASDEEPAVDIGPHCFDPFGCDFQSHCWAHVPTPSVFDLYRLNAIRKFELYQKGILQYDEIPKDYPLSAVQRLQVQTALSGSIHIDPKKIEAFLKKLRYPINFFDFETFMEPIPRFDGERPYMQIPFQYSLHILHADGRLEHREFLAREGSDPRPELAKRMLEDLTPDGSIVAFNQTFEISRIKELADAMPRYREALLALTERFVDLIEPFRNLGYYHPDFHGSFSIKSVLPALFPDDDELNYAKLGSVQNGADAMSLYANLHRVVDFAKREEIRCDLLAYCRLDTLAMVRIYEKLVDTASK